MNAWIILLFSEVTFPVRFFLIAMTLPLSAHSERPAEPSDVPLGKMCRTTTYLEALFFPTGGEKKGCCARIG